MATERQPTHSHDEVQDVAEEELETQFIDENEILAEVPDGDDHDHPMDDDDEVVVALDGQGPSEDADDVVWEDNSVQHFPAHKVSVFTVSTHPSTHLVASGGEDDLGYIWNYETGEEVVKLTGHTDSVTSTAFSNDGELIATGGMDGRIRIWRRVGNGSNWNVWEFLTELQGPDEVMWLRWHPKGPVLLAGSNDSTVWLWQLPSGNTMQVFAGHTGAVQCGEFTPDGKRIVTACADGTLMLWDPRSPAPVFKLTPEDGRFDLHGITAIGVNPASTVAVVGGNSGGIRVVNLAKGEVLGALEGHKEGESIESIQFVDLAGAGVGGGSGVVVTGGTDGKACIWDLSTMRLRATLEHEDAITRLLAHPSPKSHLITSASADRTLRTWDARTGALIREHKGHQGAILDAVLTKNGEKVVSAGDDGVCLVFVSES